MDLRISTRNRYAGRVAEVRSDSVDAEVVLELSAGERLVSIITHASVERLGLSEGSSVVALVKASSVLVSAGPTPPLTSVSNVLCGQVVHSLKGAVNGEVVLQLPSGLEIAAIVTNASMEKLALAQGKRACGLIRASSVLLVAQG